MYMKQNKYLSIFKEGVLTNNPTFVQLLGMCPTLAVTTSVTNALGMGAAVIVVLMCSNLFISLVRKLIPPEVRIASYIVIISGFVTAVELLIKAFFPAIDASLGLFIPLIVVNCIILARAEAFASKNAPLPSVVDGLATGIGFTGALTCIAAVRELLGLKEGDAEDGELPGSGAWEFTTSDPEAYDEFLQKVKDAGGDKIQAELQRQLDAWLAENPDWNQ